MKRKEVRVLNYTRKNLSLLNKAYIDESLPDGLKDEILQRLELEKKRRAAEKKKKKVKTAILITTYSILFLVIAVQNSKFKAFASEIPLLGEVISVITGEVFIHNNDKGSITITVPLIKNEQSIYKELNKLYLEDGQVEYQNSLNEIESMRNQQMDINGHYSVLVNDDKFLVIHQSTEKIVGSSMVSKKFTTIDKQNEVVLSLSMLFKNANYQKDLSEEVTKQMKERISKSSDMVYWPLENDDAYNMNEDPEFYINDDHELVLHFDKYEIAPGYMGPQEFTINKELVEELLANKDYLESEKY